MIIYTNECNPAALKLLLAASFSGKSVETRVVNGGDRTIPPPQHLPYLEVNEDSVLFVPNAGVSFLLPPSAKVASTVNEWLEWESTVIAPTLAQLFGVGSRCASLTSTIKSELNKLDKALEKQAYITDNKLNASDLVIWSTLYPLTLDASVSKDFLSDYSNITNWITKVEKDQHVKDVLKSFNLASISAAYQALLSGAKYPPISAAKQQNLSPQHCIEPVTNEEYEAVKNAWLKGAVPSKPRSKPGVILPTPEGNNILITSALPYVNNVPHLGNIIGCVLSADVFARFCRICNHTTLFIGGTDEYGTATETKALEEGLSCKAICDKYYVIHKEIYEWFNISFDHFGRTSCPEQTELCQKLFLELNENGFMFIQPVEQLHCKNCNRYLADRFVEGGCPHPGCNYENSRGDQCDKCGKLVNATELKNPRCKICGNAPKVQTSEQFFIDLPKMESLLLHTIAKLLSGWTHNAAVIAKSWFREGLKPRCITRDLKWGVPVPIESFKEKVFYVWFDAPVGYMSITKAYTDQWEQWWRPQQNQKISLYQFMAKDNVPFHAIMFPACLLGANKGYTIVSNIMATEYLNYEDGKFSKSRGVGVFGNSARDTGIPSDVWRFYLLFIRPESQDSSFSWADLATKNNSELLNNLGNFVNRALVFAKNNFDRSVPEMELTKDDYTFLVMCARELKGYVFNLDRARLREGIRHILSISRQGNQYMQANQPWVLLKGTPSDKVRAGTVIGVCCNVACLLATLLQPYMPDTSDNLKKQLNVDNLTIDVENLEIRQLLAPGHKLGEPSPLFAKLEPAKVEELKQRFAGDQSAQNAAKVNGVANGIDADNVKQENVTQKTAPASADEVKKIEEEVLQQGLVVRKLKEGGASKSEWQPEVAKLLALKAKLATLLGTPVVEKQKGKKKK